MDSILLLKNITKAFSGKEVLSGINLEVKSGRILGLLGPNGSGKTTLLKIIAGLLKQDSGEIAIAGLQPGIATKQIVSYLPDTNHLYKWMSVRDALDYFNDFYKEFDKAKAMDLLKIMKIDLNSRVTELSKGMLEKLMAVLILSRRAKLYLLDEASTSIDPLTRDAIINVILKSYTEDASIIISTNTVRDYERLFDEVAIVSNGKIVLNDEAEALRVNREMSVDDLYREVLKNA